MKPLRIATIATVLLIPQVVLAQPGRKMPLASRARGAERVLVGTVVSSVASFETNTAGDQLIISHLTVQVGDVLKGLPESTTVVDVEGGTVNGLTMKVSDVEMLRPGDKAVLFLKRGPAGREQLHLRGLGIIKLRADDVAADEDGQPTLAQVRAQVAAGVAR